MKIALSSTVSLMTKYVHKRPDSSKFQFVLRVPSELVHRYPKPVIKKSLKTSDPLVAAKRGDAEFARCQAEFARMREFRDCVFRGCGFAGCVFTLCRFVNCTFIKDNLGGDCRFDDCAWFACEQTNCEGLPVSFTTSVAR